MIEVAACGVGLTVLNCIRGDLGNDPAQLPRTPGHELVGRIVATGPGVGASRQGELVTAYFYLFCGLCRACLAGSESLCSSLAGFVGVDLDGGYQQLVSLPARNAVRLPEDLDPVSATVIPDAVATPVHVSHRARIGAGDRVAVIGAGGGVGIHMVQVARVFGGDVLGLEVSDSKLGFLESELKVAVADASDLERVSLPARWGGRCDVVVDFVGRPASLAWALSVLGEGGRLVTLTTFPGVELVASPRDLVFRQISILGSRYAGRHGLDLAARLLRGGRIEPVIGRRVPAAEVEELHAELRAGTLLGRGAIVW